MDICGTRGDETPVPRLRLSPRAIFPGRRNARPDLLGHQGEAGGGRDVEVGKTVDR